MPVVVVVALWVFALAAALHATIRGRHGWVTGAVVLMCSFIITPGWIIVPVGAAVWVLVAAIRYAFPMPSSADQRRGTSVERTSMAE